MLSDYLQEQLEKDNLSLAEFSELALRLLNYGVLCRNASQTEQILYDRFVRIQALLEDYFSLQGIRVYHDSQFRYVRLYPPGASIPGMEDADSPLGGGLRQRLSQDEIALILVLRVQYEKGLREAAVDEEGYVLDSLESLNIALQNLLSRSLPDNKAERQNLFKRLRQLRLIDFNSGETLDSGEAWLKIHPMIMQFVSDEVLQGLRNGEPADALEAAPEDAPADTGAAECES